MFSLWSSPKHKPINVGVRLRKQAKKDPPQTIAHCPQWEHAHYKQALVVLINHISPPLLGKSNEDQHGLNEAG